MTVRSDGSAVSAAALGFRVAVPEGAHRAPPVGERHPLLQVTLRALLCALVATPVRYWWAFALAGFFSSVNHNAHAGDPVSQIVLFLVADAIEVFGAALGVRRFAGGLGAFESPRNLVSYLIVVVVAPFVSAFVSSLAAPAEAHWALWRSWFLTDAFGY